MTNDEGGNRPPAGSDQAVPGTPGADSTPTKPALPTSPDPKSPRPSNWSLVGSADDRQITEDAIPGYKILDRIGVGGMGAVYMARQLSLDRIVALKLLSSELSQVPDFIKRFEKEAKAMACLNHVNITAVHDRGSVDDIFYFAMEFVDGISLADILKEGTPSPEETIRLFLLVCAGVAYSHKQGVIHRDLKPGNILVNIAGKIKITDFGLAAIADTRHSDAITKTNVAIGTVNYMAPEQREDAKNVDHRADIYSLGVILYEMLTGRVPLGIFEPPSELLGGRVSPRIDEIITKCLARSPQRRYLSVDDLEADVNALKNDLASAEPMSYQQTFVGDTSLPPAPVTPSHAAHPQVPAPPPQASPPPASPPPDRGIPTDQDAFPDTDPGPTVAPDNVQTEPERKSATKKVPLPEADEPRRRSWGGLLALVLLGGAAGAYFYKDRILPTPDPTQTPAGAITGVKITEIWKKKLAGSSVSPLVFNDMNGDDKQDVVAVLDGKSIVGLNSQGQRIAQEKSVGHLLGDPLVFDGNGDGKSDLYFSTAAGAVAAFDFRGKPLWTWRHPTPARKARPLLAGATMRGKPYVYVASNDGHVRALDGKNGTLVWMTKGLTVSLKVGVTVVNKRGVPEALVVVGQDGIVYGLAPDTGRRLWSSALGGAVKGSVNVSPDGGQMTVAVGPRQILSLHPRLGTILWKVDAPAPLRSPPLALDAGEGPSIIAATRTGVIGLRDGKILWKTATGKSTDRSTRIAHAWLPGTPPLRLAVCAVDDRLYVLNARSGAVLSQHPAGGLLRSAPAVAGGSPGTTPMLALSSEGEMVHLVALRRKAAQSSTN